MTEPAPGKYERPRFFRRHPGISLVILVAAVAVSLDFLAGLIYRLVIQPQLRDAAAESRKKELVEHNPYYHHGLLPNRSAKNISWGNRRYSIYTNSLGLRDASNRTMDSVSDRCRILLMGDSFTFGVGVDFEQSFAGIIEKRLLLDKVEVLNAAGESYSPVIYYRRIEDLVSRQGLHFDEVVVFLDIGDPEDEALFYEIDEKDNVVSKDVTWLPRAQFEESGPQSILARVVGFLRDHTILFRYFWINLRLRYALPRTNLKRSMWTVDKALYDEFGEVGLNKMRESMDRLRDFLAERRIPLTIAVYPWPDQIVDKDLDSIQVRFWREWADKNDVGFFNLFPVFIRGQNPVDTLRKYYIKGDVHWNQAGHKLVAEKFLDFYCRNSDRAGGCRARVCGGDRVR